MLDSAVPIGLTWAAFLLGTTVGLMILLRPRVVRRRRRRIAAFAALVLVASTFLGLAVAGVYVWPEARTFFDHTVAALTTVLFAWIYAVLSLFVSLVVLPMKRERSPRRGGFSIPQHGP